MFFLKKIEALEKRIEELEKGQTFRIYGDSPLWPVAEAPITEVVEEILRYFQLKVQCSPARPITWIVRKSDE